MHGIVRHSGTVESAILSTLCGASSVAAAAEASRAPDSASVNFIFHKWWFSSCCSAKRSGAHWKCIGAAEQTRAFSLIGKRNEEKKSNSETLRSFGRMSVRLTNISSRGFSQTIFRFPLSASDAALLFLALIKTFCKSSIHSRLPRPLYFH